MKFAEGETNRLDNGFVRLLSRATIHSAKLRRLADSIEPEDLFDEALTEFPMYGESLALRLVGYFCTRIAANLEHYKGDPEERLADFCHSLVWLGGRVLDNLDFSEPARKKNLSLIRRQCPVVFAFLDMVPPEYLKERAYLLQDAREEWADYA